MLFLDKEPKDKVEKSGELKRESATAGLELMGDTVALSWNSMVGLTSAKTMKVKGTTSQQELAFLIDSGATHNLISTQSVINSPYLFVIQLVMELP